MADDIVRRLRQHAEWLSSTTTGEVCADAADEIERLRAAGDALAEALSAWIDGMDAFEGDQDRLRAWREARRG